MAINYFGQRRLEKILFLFLSERQDIIQSIRSSCKEYGKDVVFEYKRHKGSEWLNIHEVVGDVSYSFKISACGENTKYIVLREHNTFEVNDKEIIKDDNCYHARYTKDFYPFEGHQRIRCHDICKSQPTGKIIKVYQTEDKEYFSLEPIDDNEIYNNSSKGDVYECMLPPSCYLEYMYGLLTIKCYSMLGEVYIEKGEDGLPYLQYSFYYNKDRSQGKEFYSDKFLSVKKLAQKEMTKKGK